MLIEAIAFSRFCDNRVVKVLRGKRINSLRNRRGKEEMVRNFVIILAVALLALMGCGKAPAMEDPGNLTIYRDQVGESLTFQVTGDASASVWGTDIYTDDSYLAAVAVHAGILEDGETGTVVVTILPGEESYTGSTRNDVTSWDYGSWSGSYAVE